MMPFTRSVPVVGAVLSGPSPPSPEADGSQCITLQKCSCLCKEHLHALVLNLFLDEAISLRPVSGGRCSAHYRLATGLPFTQALVTVVFAFIPKICSFLSV